MPDQRPYHYGNSRKASTRFTCSWKISSVPDSANLPRRAFCVAVGEGRCGIPTFIAESPRSRVRVLCRRRLVPRAVPVSAGKKAYWPKAWSTGAPGGRTRFCDGWVIGADGVPYPFLRAGRMPGRTRFCGASRRNGYAFSLAASQGSQKRVRSGYRSREGGGNVRVRQPPIVCIRTRFCGRIRRNGYANGLRTCVIIGIRRNGYAFLGGWPD